MSNEKYLNELVEVYVRKPEGEADNAFVVTLNGVNYQIRYGEKVKVPRKVALIIEESDRNMAKADEAAARFLNNFLGNC
ncbi:MAG: hypothetical protein IKV64_04795 [Clostridia bacterium]|nr:hypothetical protein [Clostridia bacterium]